MTRKKPGPDIRGPRRPASSPALALLEGLWSQGRQEEVLQKLQDMLRLDPGDRPGARHVLLARLLYLDRDAEAETLLARYPDEESTPWAFARALLAYRCDGDVIPSRQLLKKARKLNPHVIDYLAGRNDPLPATPEAFREGDTNEALVYVSQFLPAWRFTPGAIAWIRVNDGVKRTAPLAGEGPTEASRKWLHERMPACAEIWQAEFTQSDRWSRLAGQHIRLWTTVVTVPDSDLILSHAVSRVEPTLPELWDTLAQAMQHPAMGTPRRPAEIQVRQAPVWESMREHLADVGVCLSCQDEPAHARRVLRELSAHLAGPTRPALLATAGLTPERVAHFYDAAATFFQAAPWKKTGSQWIFKVECPELNLGIWYARVTGHSGRDLGLSLEQDQTRHLPGVADRSEEKHRQGTGLMVTFGEVWQTTVADVEAARDHGWRIDRSDAYPEAVIREGATERRPNARELELLEGCLRNACEFITRRRHQDSRVETFSSQSGPGTLTFSLSWVRGV